MEEIDLENGQARVETDGQTITEQVKQAYADAYDMDHGFDKEERCLSFLADEWVEPERAIQLVEYIGPYNAFDPEQAGAKIREADEHTDHLRVAIGREGSPVLYFETDNPSEVARAFEAYADEYGEVEPPDVAGKERYRVEDPIVPEHSSCHHDEPPVGPGHEARGDPENGLTYIRAWWD